MSTLLSQLVESKIPAWAPFFVVLLCANHGVCQSAPPSPNRPWHSSAEPDFAREAAALQNSLPAINPDKIYTLAELIDLAERQNPETRVAWERARAQAASLGIARSQLYPTLAATALARIDRVDTYFNSTAFHQTLTAAGGGLALNYIVFDFGARFDRIDSAKAEVLAANFAFNDTHRRVIYQVEQTYYQLLNAYGQIDADEVSLTNALVAQQSAEDRLRHGLATLPDVLEARSATAAAEYQLQAVQGAKDIAQGNLAQALDVSPTFLIRTQPLAELVIPESISDTVEQALDRAFVQRPDLMQQLAQVRSANAKVKEARSAYYPTLNFFASGGPQWTTGQQGSLPEGITSDVTGEVGLNLTWTLFDGGARRNRLAQTKADVLGAEARVKSSRDLVAQQVWTAYANLRTAFRERQSAIALLTASDESYTAALASYKHGVRNFLDVTAAQRTLAQARSTDVQARTDVLSALAELAFQTGNLIQRSATPTKQ